MSPMIARLPDNHFHRQHSSAKTHVVASIRRSLLRIATVLMTVLLLGIPFVASAQEAPQLEINSKHYLVMNADTGDVFAQKDARDQVAIASLTKLFTAVEALELAPLDTEITTDESDLKSADATTMGFGPGETYTLKDLLYGMLLPSGNDAAHAIARSLGGQPGDTPDQAVQRFMDLINERVLDMGLKDTHLVNPDGWGVPGHYSSAWDLATFMSYAMNYPTIVEIIGTSTYTTSNGFLTVSQSNKMINTYAALVGGKTGYDDDAGWCLVNLAKEGDTRMIAVTLDGVAPDDWYDDNTVLLDYGFDQQASLTASNKPFTGDIVSYVDPAIGKIAESAQPQTTLPPLSASAQTNRPETAEIPEVAPAVIETTPAPTLQRIAPSGREVAIFLAFVLILAPSFLAYRFNWGRGNRGHPDVDTSATIL